MILLLALSLLLQPAPREFADVRATIASAITARDELSDDERAEWRGQADGALDQWLTFRDAQCDARLIAHARATSPAAASEASRACRDRIAQVIRDDYAFRYGDGERARASATESMKKAETAASEEPCDKAPPRDCDYCGINACWKARLDRDDVALNAAWRAALARIVASPIAPADRTDWTARLRAAQRAWLAWRDGDCALQAWETPNRFAHSIYSGVTAPCIEAETLARIRWLRTGGAPD